MEERTDFLRQMSDEISEKGIVVIEKIDRMPVYGEPYVSPFFIIAINHRGKITLQYDGLEETFTPKDISIVYPNHELFCQSTSPMYKATLIVVSVKIFNHLVGVNTGHERFWHETSPHFHLTDSQYTDIMNVVRALDTVQKLSHTAVGDYALWQMHILITMINVFRNENDTQPTQQTYLSPRFYKAIKEHCYQHHDVAFYADIFCLSPKYFSTIIRQETGRSAGHWIRQYLLAQSKIALRNESGLRINEVGEKMGFPDLAAFSRFFNREMGLSPSEYRQQQMADK